MKSLHLVAPALLFGLAAFGAAAATGVFVEGAALAPFTAPTELELGRDRDAPFRALQGQHFVQPGRSTVVVIRLDVQDTGTRGMAMENGRVDRLHIEATIRGIPEGPVRLAHRRPETCHVKGSVERVEFAKLGHRYGRAGDWSQVMFPRTEPELGSVMLRCVYDPRP